MTTNNPVTDRAREAAQSILWVKTLIDDREAIEQAFQRVIDETTRDILAGQSVGEGKALRSLSRAWQACRDAGWPGDDCETDIADAIRALAGQSVGVVVCPICHDADGRAHCDVCANAGHLTIEEAAGWLRAKALAEQSVGDCVLVPREPAPAMVSAGERGLSDEGIDNVGSSDAIACWSAMLAAAPASNSPAIPECTSCHGLNTSCPDGCGRDPVTGELDGSRLERAPAIPAECDANCDDPDCPYMHTPASHTAPAIRYLESSDRRVQFHEPTVLTNLQWAQFSTGQPVDGADDIALEDSGHATPDALDRLLRDLEANPASPPPWILANWESFADDLRAAFATPAPSRDEVERT